MVINKTGIFIVKAKAQIIPPKNNDPVSPIKTFAGYAFQKRKPKHPPTKAADTILKPIILKIPAITMKKSPAKNVSDASNPSIPSVKFTAFTMPTINTAQIGQ